MRHSTQPQLRAVIGGEMSILPTDLRSAGAEHAWPSFGKRFQLRCDVGRSALQLALLDWRSRRAVSSDLVVWVPSYLCPSVGCAITQLGLTARTYSDRPGGAAWAGGPMPAAGDFVVVVHYFGLLNPAAVRWLDAHRSRDWAVLEDCVQSPYTQQAGERGDYAIASLRKWWPAPDGAVVSANAPLNVPALSPPNEAFVSRRTAAKLLRGHLGDEATCLSWTAESEDLLDRDQPREPSWVAVQLLGGASPAAAGEVRRGNWSELAAGLQQQPRVEPLFDSLGPGETPLVYPILVRESERDPLRQFLRAAQVYCPVHWQLCADASAADRDMSRRILSIPLDQRYEPAHMQIVVERINEFFRKSAT